MKAAHTLLAALAAGTGLIGLGSFALADEGPQTDPSSLPISQEQAMSIALQTVPGSVTGTELESEDGVTLWEIEILDGSKQTVELAIDANTGEVLANHSGDDRDEGDADDGEDDDGQAEQVESQGQNGN